MRPAPGMAVGLEQSDVVAETDLGAVIAAVLVKRRPALRTVECDAPGRGCEFRVLDLGTLTQ